MPFCSEIRTEILQICFFPCSGQPPMFSDSSKPLSIVQHTIVAQYFYPKGLPIFMFTQNPLF